MDASTLTLFYALPILAAAAIFCVPKEKVGWVRALAVLAGLGTLAISIFVYATYDPNGPQWQFETYQPWIPSLHIGYHLAVDGISVPMVLLTGILNLAAILISFSVKERVKEYFIFLLLVEAGVAGSFVSLDLFFFIIFYELASIPIYFLIGMWGSDGQQASRSWVTKREFSALKLLIYLQLGGALILTGFFLLYLFAPQAGLPYSTFDFIELSRANFGQIANFSRIVFPLLFVAFGIEAGLFPFHTWLPDGHSAAPTAVSMLLAGVLLKMGAYGMIRFAAGLMPDAGKLWLPLFGVIAVINILYGAWCALKQTDIKYIIAYSSVSHMGIVFLGLASQNIIGWSGALFQMFSHGIVTALLFALAGILYEKTHTRNVMNLGGLAPQMPFVAVCFVLGGLASLGLPGMSGFVAEFLTFMGTYGWMKGLMIVSTLGLVLTALYILLTVKKVFFGPLNDAYKDETYKNFWWEKVPVAGLIMITLLFGIMPSLLTALSQNSIGPMIRALSGMAH